MMRIIILIILLSTIALFNGCDPGGELTVVNNSSEEIQIYVYNLPILLPSQAQIYKRYFGTVPRDTSKIVGGITYTQGRDQMFRIEARSTSGEVVFLKDLTAQDLINMNWTITIPPE